MTHKQQRPGSRPTAQSARNNNKSIHSNSLPLQRRRVEQALRHADCGLTTIEMRRHLDVMAPAARIHELRWLFGLNIQTHWSEGFTEAGKRHRVARYVLLPGAWMGEAA